MGELNREIIYAISQMKEFERFLDSDLECCVLMDMHLALLASMVRTAQYLDSSFFAQVCTTAMDTGINGTQINSTTAESIFTKPSTTNSVSGASMA